MPPAGLTVAHANAQCDRSTGRVTATIDLTGRSILRKHPRLQAARSALTMQLLGGTMRSN
jgi:hypothetical protein